jgi:NADPH:quinone reductase-like Zn-dependent oxidoreductase
MRAWQVHELGQAWDVLTLGEVPVPEPGQGEVRVRVEAAGLNFPDLLLCAGQYQERPALPFIPGLEVCGEVVAAGPGAEHAVGDRVIGAPMPAGGLADQAILPFGGAFAIPAEMPAAEAAALFITYQTAHFGLHRRAALRPGETLLVHAGASGTGSAAIQLGKAAGATVIATAGGANKAEVCHQLGADVAIDYTSGDFVQGVKEATGGRGADVIWDPVGGDVFDASRRCIAFEGRLVVVGFASGRIPEAPPNHALVKNYSVVGLHWGLYRRKQPALIGQVHAELLKLYADGAIKPLVGQERPLTEAPDAYRDLAARLAVGKIVLVP